MKLNQWIIPSLLPIQVLLVNWTSKHEHWIENNYSLGIYPKISQFLRSVFGVFPFSIGDIIYCIVTITIIHFFWKKIRSHKFSWGQFFLKALKVTSIIYFLFHVLWGFNYYRLPLHKVLNISPNYTTEELETTTLTLVTIANKHHIKLTKNDSVAVKIPYTTNEIFKKTSEAYVGLQQKFPKLNYKPRSIKKSLLSTPLTYMGFSGYLNPFTNEAQVSRLIVPYKMPTTSCHEEAHQLGFAKENEANFIGAMACMQSPDPYFKYSGYTFALRYCINELYRRDQQKGVCAIEKINIGIRKNYNEVTAFWKKYENPTEPIFKVIYNQFLKVNNQSGGIKSYSYIVALLVNYSITNKLE